MLLNKRNYIYCIYMYTVKHAQAVTSIKQSPVLKGDFFSRSVIENFIVTELLLRGHLS